MLKIIASLLAASFAAPCAAAPALIADVAVSSATASKPARGGGGVRIKEGKPFEIAVWGSGGAVAGSLAGPLGAIIGGGAGAICGLLYSIFIVPHNGPERMVSRETRSRTAFGAN